MPQRYRHRRSFDPTTPFPSLIDPGEIAVNTANRQMVAGDAHTASPGVSLPLLAVRVFDVRAKYAIGDYTVQTGQLYRCKVVHGPAAFNPANFAKLSDDDARDAAAAAAYLPLTGGTLSGPLSLPLVPAVDANATSKKYVDDQIAANVAGGVAAGSVSNVPAGGISSTNVQAALNELDTEKAPKASPAFTGTPTAPTPAANDNTTKLATTAFVLGQASSAAPAMDGAAAVGTALTYARGDHVHPTDTSRAPIDSPALTGVPTAPTPNPGDDTTRIATTAYVLAASIANIADGIVTFAKMAASAIATTAQFWANTAQKILTTDQVWAAAVPVAIPDTAVITPDFGAGIDFTWTIGASGRTVADPFNLKVGQKGMIYITQDATGGRTITTWGSKYKFPGGTKPTLSLAANAVDCLSYSVKSTTEIECFFAAGMA